MRNRGAAERKFGREPRPAAAEARRGKAEGREDRDRQVERHQSADLADLLTTMEEEREMEEVRATWAETLQNA